MSLSCFYFDFKCLYSPYLQNDLNLICILLMDYCAIRSVSSLPFHRHLALTCVMYGLEVMAIFPLTAPITPGVPLSAPALGPIHRPLYPQVAQSLTKGDPNSGVKSDPAPAVWELVPLPF